MKSLLGAVLIAVLAMALIAIPSQRSEVAVQDPVALNQSGLACYFGEGVPKDLARARDFFQAAAERGYAPAQVNLGMMYDHGDGMSRVYAMARHWYQKAADQGERSGQLLLGYMYFYGLGGKDDHKRAMYYFVAANSGATGQKNAAATLPVPQTRLVEVAAR